jgi:chromosome segregation ATPase
MLKINKKGNQQQQQLESLQAEVNGLRHDLVTANATLAVALENNKKLEETVRLLREENAKLLAELEEPIIRISTK